MSNVQTHVALFVLVECDPHSNHRNPKGVYKVNVVEEETPLHCACAAVQLVRDYAPFVEENIDKTNIRVFADDGTEIKIAANVDPRFYDLGLFEGRCQDVPESITLQ